MSHLRPAFEKELKFKLTQKTKANQPEDATLIKHFRYFDLNNAGSLNRDQFWQAILKIGINNFDKTVLISSFINFRKSINFSMSMTKITMESSIIKNSLRLSTEAHPFSMLRKRINPKVDRSCSLLKKNSITF
jgi:hypothetical protein